MPGRLQGEAELSATTPPDSARHAGRLPRSAPAARRRRPSASSSRRSCARRAPSSTPHAGMGAWIDTYHAVRALTRRDTFVCLTDSAVGRAGRGQPPPPGHQPRAGRRSLAHRAVPDLEAHARLLPGLRRRGRGSTASRRWSSSAATRRVGAPRCVEHAWQLRKAIREVEPELRLGGWANPHHTPASQVGYLLDGDATADFYLTQIVSHHDRAKVGAFVAEAARRGPDDPGRVRRLLLPERQPEDAEDPRRLHAGAGRRR